MELTDIPHTCLQFHSDLNNRMGWDVGVGGLEGLGVERWGAGGAASDRSAHILH